MEPMPRPYGLLSTALQETIRIGFVHRVSTLYTKNTEKKIPGSYCKLFLFVSN